MSDRTIQHPGIEIREIDLTEYRDTITTNNAYVMGFTDKGPIYDYSWITTRSEFINLYGQPQTEAEKYLYYAVQSILNNGGTPIVSRMPYDNKQCKSYKALTIKYDVEASDETGAAAAFAARNPIKNISENILAGKFIYDSMDNSIVSGRTLSDVLSGKIFISADGTTKKSASKLTYAEAILSLYSENLSGTLADSIPSDTGYFTKLSGAAEDPIEINSVVSLPFVAIETALSSVVSGDLSKAISTNISGADESLKILDHNLRDIFLNPRFDYIVEDTTKNILDPEDQLKIDAQLLNTNEINYENMVLLNTDEVYINNDQYDDLVTMNKFSSNNEDVAYGEDISDANFIIIDKQKSIVDGVGSNEGFFVALVDPYDALKMQRLLVNPASTVTIPSGVGEDTLAFYANESKNVWKNMFKTEINQLNTLQHVVNAEGINVGEVPKQNGKTQLLDSWSVPLVGDYYDESISKTIMGLFPQIPLTDIASNAKAGTTICTIDKQYSSYICVVVCKTVINPSDGKITVAVVEQFFGSLFDEKNPQNGRDLFIGNIINNNSKYIEFYRNNVISPVFGAGTDPELAAKEVPQIFIKDSAAYNNALKFKGLSDGEIKGTSTDTENLEQKAANNNIFAFDKANTILYNHTPTAHFTSFSKKEAQKVIANTTGLYGENDIYIGNVAKNFVLDMDRCINFIKNVDDIPMYFVVDAGLSTIAQYCDNIVWDKTKKGFITQNFDPDNDPDTEDRSITSYEDVSTWRKVVDKLDQISREIRRDCMTIIDAPRQLTLDGAAPKIRRSKPQNTWDEIIGDKLRFISGINSSYTAGYYNWLRTTDEFSGKSFWLPPTCKLIGNYMYLNALNLPWLAPAGINYGTLTGIHGISHNPNSQEEDQIYMKSWNYVKLYPFDGFIVEGQKTTLTKNSAFNRINVRTLFLDLERFVYNVARNFKYTVNNQYTREQFVQTLKVKFDDYMTRHGIYDYIIKCDDTNNTPETIDANELRCAIYIKPARLIEYIIVDFVAAKTGANFEEIIL